MNKIDFIWNDLLNDSSFRTGMIMKRYSAECIPDLFIALVMPEKVKCIAVRTDNICDLSGLNQLKDISVKFVKEGALDKGNLLVLSLRDDQLSDIFSALCEDLFQSIFYVSEEDKIIATLLDRIQQWKKLFEQARETGLSLIKQIGLYGELYFLQKLVAKTNDLKFSLDLWTGPDQGIRDFEYKNWAVEVKSSIAHEPQKLHINSLRQLDCTLLENLYIYHVSIELRKGCDNNLNKIINNLRDIFSQSTYVLARFELNLIKLGYYAIHKELYDKHGFLLRNETFYGVYDNFPRIEEKQVSEKIGAVKYVIIPPFEEKFKRGFLQVMETLEM